MVRPHSASRWLLGVSLAFGATNVAASQASFAQAQPPAKSAPATATTAAPAPTTVDADAPPLPGHSYHGEAFDEGPRQAAYLMEGMGNVSFKVTTKDPEAQKFFNQGIAQLHGFWYFEAERSFRQAAALDPKCAMAYWGMAMANVNNTKRAEKFIAEAVERRAQASPREQQWIDAWSEFYKAEPKPAAPVAPANPAATPAVAPPSGTAPSGTAAKPATPPAAVAAAKPTGTKPASPPAPVSPPTAAATTAAKPAAPAPQPARPADPNQDKNRRLALIRALETLVQDDPKDAEAKAFLVLQIWLSRGPLPISSHQAVDALIDQIFDLNPMHPVHHYRIHLWDDQKAIRALKSAALGGQATPGIAHMWHMPGHTFSKLERYADAAWQQEAASRTDHAYMIRDYVMPDQIHNYAHNHEWLIRDLSLTGRVRYGLELARNLTELPRHPKYNTLARGGSAQFGRDRTVELLQRYELYADLLALADSPYLEPTDLPREQVKRLRALGVAANETGDISAGTKYAKALDEMLTREQKAQKEAGDKAEADAKQKKLPQDKIAKAKNDAMNPQRAQIALVEAALADMRAHAAIRDERFADAITQLKKAGTTGGSLLARINLLAGNKAEAEKLARSAATSGKGQVLPQANLAYVLWKCDKKDEAKKVFEELRSLAAAAELDVPPLARLAPLAKELGWPADWRQAGATRTDIGNRPPLASLGPILYHAAAAPEFALTTLDGKAISPASLRGRNVVLLFYLGTGCLHCTEQLKAFAAMHKDYQSAGFEVIAVSTDDAATLRTAAAALKPAERYPFPIAPNEDLSVFKKYRVYDDFEKQPLHATIFIDKAGALRWKDVGPEPFMDAKFLLQEAKRLSSFTKPTNTVAPPAATVRASAE